MGAPPHVTEIRGHLGRGELFRLNQLVISPTKDEHCRVAELDLHPPEHPRLPREAEKLQDPHRSPTDLESYIYKVFLRFKELPDFDAQPAPTPHELQKASEVLDEIASRPPHPLEDQDERILQLLNLISDYPHLFGKIGYFLAAEIMNAARNNIQNSEFRRAFFREYAEAMPSIREYLRNVAGLRRRARSANYSPRNVPPTQWGNAERRAAAREQMELIQALPDYYVMEKFWRTVEIICAYPDFFSKSQFEQLTSRKGIEQAWRAHLAKARQDFNYYKGIIRTGEMFRKMVDSAVEALRTIIRERIAENPPLP
jgi:hypothetical protein